jgi:hypothetical protein
MSESRAVVDWDAIFKKGVRAEDGKDVGIVVGVSDRNVIIQKGVTRDSCQRKMWKALTAMRYSST